MNRRTVNRIRLENLYQSKDIYKKVYKFMESEFEKTFEALLEKAKTEKPFLTEPALLMEEKIKRYFIEYGYKIDCIDDIEDLLLKFKAFGGANCKYTKARKTFYNIPESPEKKIKRSCDFTYVPLDIWHYK